MVERLVDYLLEESHPKVEGVVELLGDVLANQLIKYLKNQIKNLKGLIVCFSLKNLTQYFLANLQYRVSYIDYQLINLFIKGVASLDVLVLLCDSQDNHE